MNKKMLSKITHMVLAGEDMYGVIDEIEGSKKLMTWCGALFDLMELEKVVRDKAERGPCVHDRVEWTRELEQVQRIKRAIAKTVGGDNGEE